MATVRLAATSLLTTVAETANTVTNLVSSIGTGAKMINDFASNARNNQLMAIKLGAVGYEENLRATKAMEIIASRQQLDDYIGTDQNKSDRIKAIMAEFDKALA